MNFRFQSRGPFPTLSSTIAEEEVFSASIEGKRRGKCFSLLKKNGNLPGEIQEKTTQEEKGGTS